MPIRPCRLSIVSTTVLALLLGCADAPREESEAPPPLSGGQVFADNCAVCHALPLMAYQFPQMKGRPPGFVYDALTEGAMRRIGRRLDAPSRRAAAEFFTGVRFGTPESERDYVVSPTCTGEAARFDWSDQAHPSWGGSPRNHRSVATGSGLSREDLDALAVQWVVAFPEATQLRSHPTAAGGALFVGSHNGSVYALDQATGCTRWHFKAAAEVRSAVTITALPDGAEGDAPPRRLAVFADRAANAYGVDAETGELLWKQSVDPHPSAAVTGSVSAHDGRLYVPVSSNEDVGPLDVNYPCCTHAGAVVALDARSGEILWRRSTIQEPPRVMGQTDVGTDILGPSGASVWNTPSLSPEHGLLFVGSGNNHSRPASVGSDSILAMDLVSGDLVWSHQAQVGDAWNAACLWMVEDQSGCPTPVGPDIDFGATTMLVPVDERELLVAGAKSGILHVFDAATGDLVWKRRVSQGGAEDGIRYGMATRDGVLYVPSTDSRKDPNHGETARPGLYAISLADGAPLWSVDRASLCAEPGGCEDEIGAPPLVMDELLFVGAIDGMLYALDRATGEVLWRFETARSFTTLRGTPTEGGAIYGTVGPMYANGRLFVSSGYGQAERPGNALIALAPE